MRAVVVYCHPNDTSLCASLRDAAVRGLTEAQHHVDVIDLAKDNFDPVMSLQEWEMYYGSSTSIPVELQRYVDLVRQAEILVFVYATWWSSVPAQLKGWLERVLVPGVGFDLSQNMLNRGMLKQTKYLFVLTTFGSPRWYVKFVNDNGRRLFSRALRLSMSLTTRYHQLSLYALDKRTAQDREKFIAKVESAFRKL